MFPRKWKNRGERSNTYQTHLCWIEWLEGWRVWCFGWSWCKDVWICGEGEGRFHANEGGKLLLCLQLVFFLLFNLSRFVFYITVFHSWLINLFSTECSLYYFRQWRSLPPKKNGGKFYYTRVNDDQFSNFVIISFSMAICINIIMKIDHLLICFGPTN